MPTKYSTIGRTNTTGSDASVDKRPQRGDIWIVNFNSPITAKTPPDGTPSSQWPTTGDEINKARPALVLSINESWEKRLHIVVPLRQWRRRFAERSYFWIVPIARDGVNKLLRDSGADAFQVKSISIKRFGKRVGAVNTDQLNEITTAVAFCIGFPPPSAHK